MSIDKDTLDWFAQNPHNLYECFWCGQWEKWNGDPEVILNDPEPCFRCKIGHLVIREGHALVPSFKTWEEKLNSQKEKEI